MEFGPFTAEEMKDFHSRGLLREIDHIRLEGEDQWIPVEIWVASVAPAPKPAAKKAKAAAPKAKEPAAKPKTKSAAPKKPKKTD